jgi:hypothetical protein
MIEKYHHILLTGGKQSLLDGDTDWRANELPHVYAAYTVGRGIEILITGHFVTDNEDETQRYGNRKYLINLLEYFQTQSTKQFDQFFLPKQEETKMKILFVAADPTDATRLRLTDEFRVIKNELVAATKRADFELALPALAVRIGDFSKALLDEKPKIVHFSGHGASSGELCFENESGNVETVNPDGIATLFKLSSKYVECVILNACYSEIQAREIVKHINYVVGMNKSIPDPVAIAFSLGFYQALGSGEDIPTAYEYGCAQIQMRYKYEHTIPVLLKKE